MIKETVCTVCPKGCAVKVEINGNEIISVVGNTCDKGREFAINEATCPRRVITSTVKVDGESEMLPVRTNGAVKKELIFEIMAKIKAVKVFTKVKTGDIIVENIDGEGTSLVAARSM